MLFVTAVLNLFGSALAFLFGWLPVVKLDTLYSLGVGGIDVVTVFGWLNWFIPVADLGIIATSFFAFVTAYNVWLIYTGVITRKGN